MKEAGWDLGYHFTHPYDLRFSKNNPLFLLASFISDTNRQSSYSQQQQELLTLAEAVAPLSSLGKPLLYASEEGKASSYFMMEKLRLSDDKVVCSRPGSQQKKNQHQSPGVSGVHWSMLWLAHFHPVSLLLLAREPGHIPCTLCGCPSSGMRSKLGWGVGDGRAHFPVG